MRLKLSKSKYRVLLTEVLPYERPLFFSNKFFARILKYYGVSIIEGKLVAQKHRDHEGLAEFLNLLSGTSSQIVNYNYRISKDGYQDGRTLTIMHPMHQIQTMELYDKYSDLMLYYCSISRFSIRHPWKVASAVKIQTTYDKVISDLQKPVVSTECAKSYFIYKQYSNIAEFYEDNRLINVEKDFQFLLKVDIEHCFDSINPDILPLLVYDILRQCKIEYVKNDFIFELIRLHKEARIGLTEGEKEYNGIIIGPEFSRIFAEIFLQHIEVLVEKRLENIHLLKIRKDYKIFRYVDDSFIAAKSLDDIITIKAVYSEILAGFGLKLKESKGLLFSEPPFIADISLIKSRLTELINETFENRLETFIGFKKVQDGNYGDSPTFHSSKLFIKKLRVIVAETKFASTKENLSSSFSNDLKPDSAYKDISAYILKLINKNLLKLLKEFNALYKSYSESIFREQISDKGRNIKSAYETQFKKFSENLIRSLFFVFASDMRMSTSISVIRTIDILQRFVRGKYKFSIDVTSEKFPSKIISEIDAVITEETLKILRHKRIQGESGMMEVLSLLDLQYQMYPRNKIGEKPILAFLKYNGTYSQLHFFTAFQLLHFANGKTRYSGIMEFVKPWLDSKFAKFVETKGSDTESLLTVLEWMMINIKTVGKIEELDEHLVENISLQKVHRFLHRYGNMFIKWSGFSVEEEISQRKGQNVY